MAAVKSQSEVWHGREVLLLVLVVVPMSPSDSSLTGPEIEIESFCASHNFHRSLAAVVVPSASVNRGRN